MDIAVNLSAGRVVGHPAGNLLERGLVEDIRSRGMTERMEAQGICRFFLTCDPQGNFIGSAASFVDAKPWCERRLGHRN